MPDYTKCCESTLLNHLSATLGEGGASARVRGVYYEEASRELELREALGCYVSLCNTARDTAEGYELCEDCDPTTHVVTFYVMREDGISMLEFPVMFIIWDCETPEQLQLLLHPSSPN